MSLIFTSSIGCPGIPAKIELIALGAPLAQTSDIAQNDSAAIFPTATPSGPRIRAPSRIKIGAPYTSRIVMLVHVTSSITAPSTDSIASPQHPSNTQFEIVMFLNPPFDSVPNLIRPVRGTFASVGKSLERPIEQRPFLITARDHAIADRDHLGRARIPQRKRTLQTDAVIPRRIHAAIRNAHIPAAINIHAIAVRIDFQIVDRQVIDARRQNPKMPAMQN